MGLKHFEQFWMLTKSAKQNAFCVAGIDLKTFDFIRVVADRDGAAVEDPIIDFAKPLDILSFDGFFSPLKCQTENYIIKGQAEKKHIPTPPQDRLKYLKKIYDNKQIKHTDTFGTDDYYLSSISGINYSLSVIEATDIKVCANPLGKYKISFTFNGKELRNYSMTDPVFFDQHVIAKALLVLSIPHDPWPQWPHPVPPSMLRYYKFCAKIFPLKWC